MAFPDTRYTLIERIVQGGHEADWQVFFNDYWGPVCRFIRQRTRLTAEDAEDTAAQVFETLIKSRLLSRWSAERGAKLRTLLCEVIRKTLANRFRVEQGRARILAELGRESGVSAESGFDAAAAEEDDAFYAAWVEDLVYQAVESLFEDYRAAGKGDYFRVLHGRLCEEMPIAEVAKALGLKPSDVDNYYRHARERLAERHEQLVRAHVLRYAEPGNVDQEFHDEWRRLGEHLLKQGGLEAAVRRAHEERAGEHGPRFQSTLARTSQMLLEQRE